MLPEPDSDPPELRPSSGGGCHSGAEPACTTVPLSAQQLSRRRASRKGSGSFSAGGASPVSTDSRTPARGTRGEWVPLSPAVIISQPPDSDHRASLIVSRQTAGNRVGWIKGRIEVAAFSLAGQLSQVLARGCAVCP
jgi:hypothetical protein